MKIAEMAKISIKERDIDSTMEWYNILSILQEYSEDSRKEDNHEPVNHKSEKMHFGT